MRYSRHLVSLRTFGLAFAVVLTPALMQVEAQCETYVPELEALEFVVEGEDLLDGKFAPEHRVYEVEMPAGVETATLRATTPSDDAQVMCNTSTDCPPPANHGNLPDGGGEMELHDFPPGHSMLRVWIVDDGALGLYSIHVMAPAICE